MPRARVSKINMRLKASPWLRFQVLSAKRQERQNGTREVVDIPVVVLGGAVPAHIHINRSVRCPRDLHGRVPVRSGRPNELETAIGLGGRTTECRGEDGIAVSIELFEELFAAVVQNA